MGALNSTVFQAALETLGRVEGRGMMEISKGDLVSMPVLDVRNLTDGEKEAIQNAHEALENDEDDARDRLDKAVVRAMGVDVDIDRSQELREMVTNQRNDRGTTAEVLVDRVDTLEELGTHTFTVGTEEEGGDAQLSEFT